VVETIGEGDERDSRVTVTCRFGTPGTSIDPLQPPRDKGVHITL